MDEMVKAALAKWPHVPHCYGWLGLDARGDWYMRDDRTQAAGPFAQSKGSRIQHDKLREFIERNYEADAQGCWFFQNGPQRVYVELEATPLIWRLRRDEAGPLHIRAHTGQAAGPVAACWLDEAGHFYLQTTQGLGLVHSQDMALAADEVEAGRWDPQPVEGATLPARFGFVRSPQAAAHA